MVDGGRHEDELGSPGGAVVEELLAQEEQEVHVLLSLVHLVQDDVAPLGQGLPADDHLLEHAGGAVEEARLRQAVLAVHADLVAHRLADLPAPLVGNLWKEENFKVGIVSRKTYATPKLVNRTI